MSPKVISSTKQQLWQLTSIFKQKFECPICGYYGAFIPLTMATGKRQHAKCPNCCALERHRLQKLVLDELSQVKDFSNLKALHFAPESFFREYFRNLFKEYVTADLLMADVDYNVDLTNLPFQDAQFDLVYASHVLEHIQDDRKALSEIRRVLKAGGIAILPVPIVSPQTIEYSSPNPFESGHVRAPGIDYYNRYLDYFSKVEQKSSQDFPDLYQTYSYEDRTVYPTEKCPQRPPMPGKRHPGFIPVCYV